MRATIARTAIVAATILALSGCRSTGGSGWSWGRKSAPTASAMPNSNSTGPQLPSANATPPGMNPAGGYAAAPAVSQGYPDAGGAYPQTGYPGQPTGYSNPNLPPGAGAAPGVPAGSPYPATQGYAAPANPVVPQTGPYNENYGQPPQAAGMPNANGAPGNAYQSPTIQNVPYQPSGTQGAAVQSPPAYPVSTDPYGNPAPPVAGNYGDPGAHAGAGPVADYGSTPNPGAAIDNRYGAGAPVEQAPVDRYSAGNEAAANPVGADGAASVGQASTDRYQPGNTRYTPGSTGYSPPGVPPYQVPGQPNVVASGQRRDPYYRPGGTSDYLPANASQTAGAAPGGNDTAPAVDRYGVPISGASPPSYETGVASPAGGAGYQPPAGPNSGY